MVTDSKQKTAEETEKQELIKLAELAERVVQYRKKPLLVMFYRDHALSSIDEDHIELLHTALNQGGVRLSEPLKELDILIHTLGGDPVAAYRLAQVVRDFTEKATFLVPEYAYSGGTLICLSADVIMLGNHAVLSPIDITQHRNAARNNNVDSPQFKGEENRETVIELVSIDNFIKVATQARIDIETEFRKNNWSMATSKVEEAMLCKMVEQMGVVDVARVFREKNISNAYARELLTCYMFKNAGRPQVIDKILRRLVTDAPSHTFAMDYHICKDIGLKAEEMTEDLSDHCRELLKHLKKLGRQGAICKLEGVSLIPFFQLFVYHETPTIDDSKLGVPTKEARDGDAEGNGNKEKREEIITGTTTRVGI